MHKTYALDYPFVSNVECEMFSSQNYELVNDSIIENILQEMKKWECGKRQLQFLKYYAIKSNKKICFVYSKNDKNQRFSVVFPGTFVRISNQDENFIYIQIPKNEKTMSPNIIVRQEGANFILSAFNFDTNFNKKSASLDKIFSLSENMLYAFCIGHELYHVSFFFLKMNSDIQQQRYNLFLNENFSKPDSVFCNNEEDSLQEVGAFFIGEFDYLQELFGRFVVRCYSDEFCKDKIEHDLRFIFNNLRNHQLDSNFIRPKYYEHIALKENGNRDVVNTIAFLQQEDFLLEHFALKVPSDGNDAIWAIMQAMLPKENYLPVENILKDDNEKEAMLYWRSRFCETAQQDEESVSRFSENHCRIKVEDFKYIAQTIQRDIIVIEPADIHFKINVFNSDGTNYTAQKLPKLNAKTLYIYYNGYNHYQPLLLSSKLDKTISLERFLDQPQNTLSNFLNTKHFIDFVETKFLNRNYKIQDVSGNGNCGIYAILRNLGLGDDQNIALRNAIFPQNHRMRQDRAWLGMEDLHFVASYLGNAYQRDLIIVNTSPINPNIVNVITPDDHVYTRYVNGRWVRYDSLVAALNQESENTNPPVILLYTPNHWQAVLPERRATIGNVGDSNGSIPKKRRLSF